MKFAGREMNSPLLLFVAAMATQAPWAIAQQTGQIAQPPGGYQATGTAEPPSDTSPSGTAAAGVPQKGGVPFGPVTAYPSLTYGVQRNDNLYFNSVNAVADTIQLVNPAVRLEAKEGPSTYSLNLGATLGRYQKQTADDFDDYNVNGLADMSLSTHLRARLRYDYIDGHDPRGSTNNPLATTPDRWHQTYAQGIVGYGAPGAQGRVELELGEGRRDYINHRDNTAQNDHTTDDIGGTFYWRVAPKTSLLLQAKHSTIDYSLPGSLLGSKEERFLVGATWEAAAKTTGIFKIGSVKKDFTNQSGADFTGVNWEGQIAWTPLTYSRLNFTLNRTPVETTGSVGNFINETTSRALWTHDWSSQFSTEVTGSYVTDQYEGIVRKDNTQFFELKATYNVQRWLSFGADYQYTNRNSSDATFAYKRNLYMLFVRAAL